jgi:uncharacterized membrane protein YgcG
MKMLLVFVLLGVLVVVVIRSMRNQRSAVSRRMPGRDLPPRHDGTDTSYMGIGTFGTDNSHHGHGHGHGADCAPHDAGGGIDCGSDGGGGGSD